MLNKKAIQKTIPKSNKKKFAEIYSMPSLQEEKLKKNSILWRTKKEKEKLIKYKRLSM